MGTIQILCKTYCCVEVIDNNDDNIEDVNDEENKDEKEKLLHTCESIFNNNT